MCTQCNIAISEGRAELVPAMPSVGNFDEVNIAILRVSESRTKLVLILPSVSSIDTECQYKRAKRQYERA